MMLDMHCHLDLYPNPSIVAAECHSRQMYVLSVTTTPKAWEGTNSLAAGRPRIQTALGLHPQLAHERAHEVDLFDELLPETKYVGEIGLDGSRGFAGSLAIQRDVLRQILSKVRRAGGRILSLHSRASASGVLDELRGDYGIAILHWFSGTRHELRRAIEMGCWFSVGPAMMASMKGREMVAMMPKERVLVESDGPFAKVGGKPLYPWGAAAACTQLSQIWNCNDLEARELIMSNLKTLIASSTK